MVHAVSKGEDVSAISCAFKFERKSKTLHALQELSNNYLLLRSAMGDGGILGFNNAIKKSIFRKTRGFPKLPLEDGAFTKKLKKYGKVVYLPEPVVVTSSRRMKKKSALKAIVYYANLAVATDFPKSPLKRLLQYKKYIPVR